MRQLLLIVPLLLAGMSCSDKSNPIAPVRPDSLTISGTVYMLYASGDTVVAPSAHVRLWWSDPHVFITGDTLGHYALRVGTNTDTVIVYGEQDVLVGKFTTIRRVALPPDRHDLVYTLYLDFFVPVVPQP